MFINELFRLFWSVVPIIIVIYCYIRFDRTVYFSEINGRKKKIPHRKNIRKKERKKERTSRKIL